MLLAWFPARLLSSSQEASLNNDLAFACQPEGRLAKTQMHSRVMCSQDFDFATVVLIWVKISKFKIKIAQLNKNHSIYCHIE